MDLRKQEVHNDKIVVSDWPPTGEIPLNVVHLMSLSGNRSQ
jgi:hypothetical protein